MLDKLMTMWGGIEPIQLLIVVVVLLFLAVAGYYVLLLIKKSRKKEDTNDLSFESAIGTLPQGQTINIQPPVAKKQLLGTGKYYAIACPFDEPKIMATTIPQPMGNIFFDQLFGKGRNAYFVTTNEAGDILPYEPRNVKIDTKETPLFAWLMTHWQELVNGVYVDARQWWQNMNVWLTVGSLFLTFIVAILTLGK